MPEKPPPETLRDRSVRLGMESDAVVRDSADIVGRMDGVSNRKQDEPRRADPETKAETASRRLEEEIIRDELDEPSGHDSPARRPGAVLMRAGSTRARIGGCQSSAIETRTVSRSSRR